MGDRANLRLKYPNDKELVIYSHWGGSEMHAMAQRAVQRLIDSGRIGDDNYAGRIIISEIVPQEGDLSWGIGFDYACDAEYPLIEIDVNTGAVAIYPQNDDREAVWNGDAPVFMGSPTWSGTAQEYVALDYDPRWQTSNEEEAAEA